MKVRALCAAGLIAAAALPATASAGSSINHRLHRADVALNKALDAADDGNDAGVVRGLKGSNRQTALALKAALRLVARDRDGADVALYDSTDQLDTNAQAAMDLLDGASSDVVDAVDATLVAADTGRGKVLTTIQGLGDLEPDWGDALTQIADDAINELVTAADNYDAVDLSDAAEDVLTAYVSQETDAAGAIVSEIGTLAADGDAELDYDALDTLSSDAADAADALDGVSGLGSANADAVDEVVVKLGTLSDAVMEIADAIDASWDDGYYDDWGDDPYADWGWAPDGDGYRGWDDDGFGPPRHG